jgi:hypothetical protein
MQPFARRSFQRIAVTCAGSAPCRATIPAHAGPAFQSMPGRHSSACRQGYDAGLTTVTVGSFPDRKEACGGASEVTRAQDSRGFAAQI